jgi:membrane fusion protein (multidrug efflux system)
MSQRDRSRTQCRRWPAALLLLSLSAGGCREREPEKPAKPPPTSVEAMTVTERNVPVSHPFVGMTDASRRVEVRARVRGFIVARTYKEGGMVKSGDVLFELDPRPYEADLQIARSPLDKATTARAHANVEVARFTELVKADAASQKELDDATARRDSAQAEIKAAEAQVSKAELELSYTKVTSPVDGLAGKALRDVGAYVDAGLNSQLTETIEVNPIYVNFALAERDLLRSQAMIASKRLFLPEGGVMKVDLTLLDGSEYPHDGAINFRDIAIDPATGTAKARAEFANPGSDLRPGQFVRGRISGYELAGAVVVPRKAVLQNPGGSFVYVVVDGDRIDARPVELGSWIGEDVVVEKGLAEGDRLVVEGVHRIAPGMTVEATAAAAPGSSAKAPPAKGR